MVVFFNFITIQISLAVSRQARPGKWDARRYRQIFQITTTYRLRQNVRYGIINHINKFMILRVRGVMKIFRKIFFALILVVVFSSTTAFAASPATVNLGNIVDFAVFGASINNTGSTTVTGDIGIYYNLIAGNSPTGITLTGTIHDHDATAKAAKNSLLNAYTDANSRTTTKISPQLGGQTLTTGAYAPTSGTFSLTGTLTLSGSATDVFIFNSNSSFMTAANSLITFDGQAQACNVFWVTSGNVSIGSNSTFSGNVISKGEISVNTGAEINGRVLTYGSSSYPTLAYQVNLDTNTITTTSCSAATSTLNIITHVINDNSGTKLATDFMTSLITNNAIAAKSIGYEDPGNSYLSLVPGDYQIGDDVDTDEYTTSISGDCDATGNVTLAAGDTLSCTITHDDIAPASSATTTTSGTTTPGLPNTGFNNFSAISKMIQNLLI